MSMKPLHELHKRRRSRNLGVGLMLAAFIALVFGLTIAKVTSPNFSLESSGIEADQ
jgi:hypothetical protein